MNQSYPWIEWQKNGNRVTVHDEKLRSCPFCSSRRLTVSIVFDDKAARVECRTCLAEGPWCWHEERDVLIHDAVEAWNGYVRPRPNPELDGVLEN